jgi:hypothetical protein
MKILPWYNISMPLMKSLAPAQKTKNHVLPHMWTSDQGQTQEGDWTLIT